MKTKNKKCLIITLCILVISIVTLVFSNIKKEDEDLAVIAEKVSNTIIPKPLNYKDAEGKFTLNKDTKIYVKGNTEEETSEITRTAEYLKEKLSPSTGYEFTIIKNEVTNC